MVMTRKNLIYIVLFLIISVSCEKIIDINIPEKDKKIVINSIISTDSLIKVNVSKSLNILDNQNAIFLNDATVKLYEDNVFIEQLTNITNGNYKSQTFYPQVGKNYKIEVSSNGLKTITAENKIPNKVTINKIDTITKNVEGYNTFEFTINFTDPVNEENYYFLEAKSFVPLGYDNYGNIIDYDIQNLYIFSDDKIVDSEIDYNGGIIFNDKLINGQTYPLKINIDKYNFYNDTNMVYIYLNSVSKDFYLYVKSYSMNVNNRNDPFAEPVQVYENINNGYGIFAGYSSYVDSLKILGQDMIWKSRK